MVVMLKYMMDGIKTELKITMSYQYSIKGFFDFPDLVTSHGCYESDSCDHASALGGAGHDAAVVCSSRHNEP